MKDAISQQSLFEPAAANSYPNFPGAMEETDSQFIARMQKIFERSDEALNEILSEEGVLINEFLREI